VPADVNRPSRATANAGAMALMLPLLYSQFALCMRNTVKVIGQAARVAAAVAVHQYSDFSHSTNCHVLSQFLPAAAIQVPLGTRFCF